MSQPNSGLKSESGESVNFIKNRTLAGSKCPECINSNTLSIKFCNFLSDTTCGANELQNARASTSSADVKDWTNSSYLKKVKKNSNFSSRKIPIIFSNLNSNCSNSLYLRNLQEEVKKAFCYQNLQILSLQPRSLEHFFLTVGQNNFGNKIPFIKNCWQFTDANFCKFDKSILLEKMTTVKYAIHLHFETGNKSFSNDNGIFSETHIILKLVIVCTIYFWRTFLDIRLCN